MKKTNFDAVNDATSRLMKFKADQFFPALLSTEQQETIQRRRIAKEKKTGKKVLEVKDTEYILQGGGFDRDADENLIQVDDFDIARYMMEAEDEETGTLHDLKIDTRDLKQAKNFYDYCFNLLGKKARPPWSRQLWIGSMLFGEVCPCCTKPEWLNIENVPRDYKSKDMPEHMTFLVRGKCPKCKRTKWDLIQNHGLKNYIQYAGVIGQRGSKSSSTALYSSYLTHMILKFPDLSSLTASMQASTELTGTFVSLTHAKASGVLWTPYKKIIEESEWFQNYFDIMDTYGEKYGRELYKNSTLYLTFHHRNLRIYPSGPKSSTLRGDTRYFAALDELGLFPLPKGDEEEDETSERANADEAHKSLFNSLGTVSVAAYNLMKEGYNSVPPPILFNVSSPYSQRDKMMRLYRESKTADGQNTILGINLPTWELNPFYDRSTPIIASAYASNYEKAERDWGANPPAVHSRFMPVDAVSNGVFVNGVNTHNFVYQYDQPGEVYGKIEKLRTFSWPSVMAIDAGHTNNSFTIVGGHYNFDTGKTVVSTILECMPTEGRRVNFNLLYGNVILPLGFALNSVGLAADQWQGIDILYRIRADMKNNPTGKPRCLPKQYSPKRADFNNVRTMIQSGNVLFPTIKEEVKKRILDGQIQDYRTEMIGKPVEHLFLQAVTIRDTGETRCPEKGEGYTDDIFRAVALLVTTIHHPKVMERLQEARKFNYGGASSMPMPAFAGRSGGGFSRYGTRR